MSSDSDSVVRNPLLLKFAVKEQRAVMEFTNRLRSLLGTVVKEVIVFGSKSRGKGNPDSDIDVLVVLQRVSWKTKKAISGLASEVNLKYDVLISTIRYSAKSWADPKVKATPFCQVVRNEGIWL